MFGVFSARTQRSVSPSDQRANDAQLHMEIRRQHMRGSQDRDEEVRVAPRRWLPTSIRNISAASNAQRERRRRERIILGAPVYMGARREYIDPISRHFLGSMNISCPSCLALHWRDEKHTNSTTANPTFGNCCNSGNLSIPLLPNPPAALQRLYDGNDTQSREFRQNLWKYNRAFAFTSLGVAEDHSVNLGRHGPPVFRIQGELFHRSGSLLPDPGRSPTYSQLYIYEPRNALEYRIRNNSDLRPDTLNVLQSIMNTDNPYAQLYASASQILSSIRNAPDAEIRLRPAPGVHRRSGSLPTADEVAVILPGNGSEGDFRDIILRTRPGPLHRISEMHPAYAPLQYPLLFPLGTSGWHPDIPYVRPGKRSVTATLSRYTQFRIHERLGEYSTILRGGRLFQRYLVDMWAATDQQRLSFLRKNQGVLRAALYSGLEDAVEADDTADLNEIGQRVVLPSSYVGGPRHMQQQFQDSMAVARFFRKVDLFITITANPDWREIQEALFPGQTSYDRPDLISRVFHMKIHSIIKEISETGIFGKAVAHVYTIEFQKRGLPHMHLLIFLTGPDKLLTPDDIDSAIRARWPDPVSEPLLFETVKRCMVHGPCGIANPSAPCMENGKCTKNYPKPFTAFTSLDEHGYPKYIRPNDGRSYGVGGIPVDNRWIVPHNPYLSAKYDCHINVECAVSLGSFKYAFKYIHKGSDHISLTINRHDEITRHINGIRPIQNGLVILDYHIVGDIIWMQELPLTDDDMFDPPLITASGYVVSVENNMDTFTLESYPWTSTFKVNRKLPIHVEFDRDLRRFKERRPMPSVGRIVSVCGMLSGFHLEGGADTNARLTAFTIDIQEISFLSTVPQTAPANDSSSPTPLTPHRGLRYGMRSRANPRSGDRGRALPPTMQTLTMPSSPSPSFLPQLADGIVGTGLPTDPSTPPNVISEAGLGLTERTHNLRKRKKRKDDDEVANVAGGSSSLSGSSISTESTLSESVYSESTHIMDSNA